ncbi:MAG: hypothetical protein HYY40_05265 [Bacteroidetes bacterium]|nr:hypothetical protein [Bacteroidota bacterium]
MQEELFTSLSGNFEFLIPQDKESLLVLYHLFTRIENREIEESFTLKDFHDSIDDVALYLRREKSVQKEILARRLSHHFFTTLKAGDAYHFQLTVFSRDLLKLLKDELQPHYEGVELIHTFTRTLPLYDDDMSSVEKFGYWFNNHYEPARKVILAHTDSLQRFVDGRISELKQILKTDVKKARDLITRFIIVFEQIGKQTEGIIKTLKFKEVVVEKIKGAEEKFSATKEEWEKYMKIQEEIMIFFENVDRRILSISDKIEHTCSRLKSLYDTLRYKQEFKMRLEKFLNLLLVHSGVNDGEIVFPDCIGKKTIPCIREKFYYVPSYYFGNINPSALPDLAEDEEYRMKREHEKISMLQRQESVSKWVNEMICILERGNSAQYEEWFEKIFEAEKNLEVPVDVCYDMIQICNKSKIFTLDVESELYTAKTDPVTLWKMQFQPVDR